MQLFFIIVLQGPFVFGNEINKNIKYYIFNFFFFVIQNFPLAIATIKDDSLILS